MKNKSIVLCGLFAALISLCSWIAIPMAVPFTMQTFGIFSALLMLGGKRGTVSISVYILVGAAGLPVFAGFQGGIGVILSPLGGYILGFAAMGLVYLLVTEFFGEKTSVKAVGLIAGLAVCYLIGTLWYMLFSKGTDFGTAVSVCVVPFLIPDVVKIFLALMMSKRISAYAAHI
ncbi:MAG: biotin transporter BioY [Oscillospiraceae bacterium]|nr:biotin transporter BioY [Oscillospiraceae bacterium]